MATACRPTGPAGSPVSPTHCAAARLSNDKVSAGHAPGCPLTLACLPACLPDPIALCCMTHSPHCPAFTFALLHTQHAQHSSRQTLRYHSPCHAQLVAASVSASGAMLVSQSVGDVAILMLTLVVHGAMCHLAHAAARGTPQVHVHGHWCIADMALWLALSGMFDCRPWLCAAFMLVLVTGKACWIVAYGLVSCPLAAMCLPA